MYTIHFWKQIFFFVFLFNSNCIYYCYLGQIFWAEAPTILTVFSIVITQHGTTTHLTAQKFRHVMALSTYLGALYQSNGSTGPRGLANCNYGIYKN